MIYRATIELKLPSLNDYIYSCRANKYKSSSMKREIESSIAVFIRRLPRITKPVVIHFHWVEANRLRDLDNIAFSKKFILDALVRCGKLQDDSQRFVKGFSDTFEVGKSYKVMLEIEEVEEDDRK